MLIVNIGILVLKVNILLNAFILFVGCKLQQADINLRKCSNSKRTEHHQL